MFASRDAHPADQCSFRENGGIWPPHCVEGQSGSEFHPNLHLPPDVRVFSKGTLQNADAYSAFDGTGAADVLRKLGVEHLVMCGLATDYCVKASVLDALKAGFSVSVVEDGCCAVNVSPDDGEKALAEMAAAGVKIITSNDISDF